MAKLDELIADLHESRADDPDRQFNAAIALGTISDASSRARIVTELIKALGGKHQALTRAHAAEALGAFADAQAIPALIASLNDPYQLVRSYAARALGKMRDREIAKAIEPLVHQLETDRFFGARAEAAEALGNVAKLCEDMGYGDAKLLEKARATVERDDLAKLKTSDERFQRMLNEMDASIERLKKRSHYLSGEEKLALTHAEEKVRVRKGPMV
jgi:hypothetical protein